ncbi:DNA sulfur modification protein DndE [Aquabacterium olei]|uniref:DNA sulfur modification protein DndE n=1 Tax=Aquabacterium olei TaxID=1296669 RepID=A0A2U8FNR5_9BURK|nr:DNA sulfur modification protein DndE [Aquabacterium olei]AWI52034.1 DNA sulfur modification protein DndE [Aquabacterium olei]
MIERVKLSATAKQQLITLKRRTGIEHYNVICRHALMLSMASDNALPPENHSMAGGLEIDWRVFAGEAADTYLNLLAMKAQQERGEVSPEAVRATLTAHVHRGLSLLVSTNKFSI